MSEVLAKDIINELAEIFTDAGYDVSADEINDSNILSIGYGEDSAVEDGSIIITHYDDILTVFVLVTVWSGLGTKEKEDMAQFLPYLNRFLDIGVFGIDDESGDLEFRYSFIASEKTDRKKLIKMISVAYGTAENTAAEAAGITAPVISGETPAAELLNEDSVIIQY